jgi:hypothetical protein
VRATVAIVRRLGNKLRTNKYFKQKDKGERVKPKRVKLKRKPFFG